MSTLRVVTNQSLVRLTPEGESNSKLVLHASQSVIRLSEVGIPGPPGEQGDPGQDGEDGQAGLPEIIDGGNF
jgi:hypothetical protein